MLEWIMRHYRLGVILIGVVVGANCLFILGPAGVPVDVIMLVLLGALIPWVAAYYIANQKMGQDALRAINEGCDPEPLLKVSDIVIGQFDKRGRSRSNATLGCRLNRVVALSCMGRNEEAMVELNHIGLRLPRQTGQMHLLYYNNRAAVLGELGRVEEMEECLTKAMALLSGLRIPANLREISALSVRTCSCALVALKEGYTPEVEKEYEYLLTASTGMRWQVDHRYGLGRCALERGDRVEARRHLEFVANNANKLRVQEKAAALLAEME